MNTTAYITLIRNTEWDTTAHWMRCIRATTTEHDYHAFLDELHRVEMSLFAANA